MIGNRELTRIQSMVLTRAHPRRMVFEVIGWTWGVYFLWNQHWMPALGAVLISGFAGYLSTKKSDSQKIAQTTFGKIALLHLHPANISIQLAGLAGLAWALWNHSAIGILVSFSIILLGHLFGWSRVSEAFRLTHYDQAT